MNQYLAQIIQTWGLLLGDVSFWIGLTAVVTFSWTRFNERQTDESEIDPPIPSRSFTTRFRYQLAAVTYAGSYGFVYVILIVLGTIPAFQGVLKDYIGAIEGKDIGTPAWAAMAVTAILPAFKIFRAADQRLRTVLQDFASIPLKARGLADELLQGLAATLATTEDTEATGYPPLYRALLDCIDQLKTSPRLRARRAYTQFFAQYQSIQDNAEKSLESSAVASGGPESLISGGQWKVLTNRIARLITCAILQVEADEFHARRVLRDELGISGVHPARWRFTLSQVVLGIFTIVAAVVVGLVVSSLYSATTYQSTNVSSTLVLAIARQAVLIGLLAVPMFVLPLIFAAGVQMYLLDRQQLGNSLEWHELLLARVLTFCVAYGFALLPALIFAAIGAHIWDGGSVKILVWAPWAIPPAAAATLFVVLSTVNPTGSRSANAAVDFGAHAILAFGTSHLAMSLARAAGWVPDVSFELPTGTIAVVGPITAAFTAGALGALQGSVSRRTYYGEDAGRSAPDVQAIPALEPGQ